MKYPYTDFQIMNLDFLLQRMAAMQAEIDELKQHGGGGGGSDDYNDLNNKPQINGNTLSGNKTAAQLGLATPGDIPTIPVTSVNTKTGAVVLDADDVGAVPEPASPSSGDVIMWDGVAWQATNMGTVFTIKGEVATVADLPATGNTVGDVYYVSSVSAGYIWLETTDHPTGYWEELGEPIDLSMYIEKPATPSAGDYLAWDSVNQEWVAQALPLYDGS